MKFTERRRSNGLNSDFPIWRPATIRLVRCARDNLRDYNTMNASFGKETVLRPDGAGRCIIPNVKDATEGFIAYERYIRSYALEVRIIKLLNIMICLFVWLILIA